MAHRAHEVSIWQIGEIQEEAWNRSFGPRKGVPGNFLPKLGSWVLASST